MYLFASIHEKRKNNWPLIDCWRNWSIPYTILTMTFEYPGILRQDTGTILTKFHNGGSSLVLTWWAFTIPGLPLLIAYIPYRTKIRK